MHSTNLVLIGFMGSGKSSVAKALYQHTNALILDSDLVIENNENMTIPEIFSQKGETYFRNLERAFCLFVSQNIRHCIISTGGGMPLFCDIRLMGKVFFLDLSFEDILLRLSKEERLKRPLFENQKVALELYQKRYQIYKDSAHFCINANRSIQEITQEILDCFPMK